MRKIISECMLKGTAASPGIASGMAYVIDRSQVKIVYRYLQGDMVAKEEKRFRTALADTEKQLTRLKENLPDSIREHAFILDSHIMMLHDSMIEEATVNRINSEKINAEWALYKSVADVRKIFAEIDDEYIKTRISDVEGVVDRIMRNLIGGEKQKDLSNVPDGIIVVSNDLSPGDTSELNLKKVLGFITDGGGLTSHTSILARALNIPAVVGIGSATNEIRDGDFLIIDGSTGTVWINPPDDIIFKYSEKKRIHYEYRTDLLRSSVEPAVTIDGEYIKIRANVEFIEEIPDIRRHGGEGIGLYRSEFPILRSEGRVTEDDLYENYRSVVELIAPEPINIRTFDLGGDKLVSPYYIEKETNPALGLRAIRFCLKNPSLFKAQLRAILRASYKRNVRIVFPMITGVCELLEARQFLEQSKKELLAEGKNFDQNISVGIMIEVPASVAIADLLAKHVDFFSIGTNDLIQYALASDRGNEHVAYLYQPFHPAIMRMIETVVKSAIKNEIGVSLCGEMANDPLCVPLLLGMGLREFSMSARSMPFVKKLIRLLSIKKTEELLQETKSCITANGLRTVMEEHMKEILKENNESMLLLYNGDESIH